MDLDLDNIDLEYERVRLLLEISLKWLSPESPESKRLIEVEARLEARDLLAV